MMSAAFATSAALGAARTPRLHRLVHPRGIGIVANDVVPGRDQAFGEAGAHQAQPDEADALVHGIPLMRAVERPAIMIRFNRIMV